MKAIVMEQNSRAGIYIWIWIFCFAVLLQDLWSDLRVLLDELEDWVLSDFWSRGCVVHQSFESRIRLAENGVAVSWDDSAGP